MSYRPWHQFTVRRLFVLTTAVAAVIGAVWATPLPELGRIVLGGYVLAIVTYEIVRGPSRNAEFRELQIRREQIAKRRQDMLREAEDRRRRARTSSATETDSSGETRSD
jgi:hypothetical protein